MRDRLIELLEKHVLLKYFLGRMQAEKLADYLFDNGVIVPPCKVGDTVYYCSNNPLCIAVRANELYEADVVRIVTTNLGTSLVLQIRNEYGVTEISNVKDWGVSVFPSREEAVKALKGGEGK